MGATYRQYCPVAKAMELLDERWTLLVVRELLDGSARFSELRRGVPHISPTLLSKRLALLARVGVVVRDEGPPGVRYVLTPAGQDLRPVVDALGAWGLRWAGRPGDEDLDPPLLLWDMRRRVDHAALPPGRTVLQVRFPDLPRAERRWWLVLAPRGATVGDVDPGHPVALTLTADLAAMAGVWRGELSWAEALRSGRLRLDGPEPARAALPTWFTLPTWSTGSVPAGAAARPVPAGAAP